MAITKKQLAYLWYEFLQVAVFLDLDIDWEKYPGWGGEREVVPGGFEGWWLSRGSAAFCEMPVAKIVSVTDTVMRVDIPLTLTKREIHDSIDALLSRHQKPEVVGTHGFSPTGEVRYNEMLAYLRRLQVEWFSFEPDKAKRVGIVALAQERELKRVLALQKELTKLGKETEARRLKMPATVPAKKHQARYGKRWLEKGEAIMRDVAVGDFPGESYLKIRN